MTVSATSSAAASRSAAPLPCQGARIESAEAQGERYWMNPEMTVPYPLLFFAQKNIFVHRYTYVQGKKDNYLFEKIKTTFKNMVI